MVKSQKQHIFLTGYIKYILKLVRFEQSKASEPLPALIKY